MVGVRVIWTPEYVHTDKFGLLDWVLWTCDLSQVHRPKVPIDRRADKRKVRIGVGVGVEPLGLGLYGHM